jgi:hypothetical protein
MIATSIILGLNLSDIAISDNKINAYGRMKGTAPTISSQTSTKITAGTHAIASFEQTRGEHRSTLSEQNLCFSIVERQAARDSFGIAIARRNAGPVQKARHRYERGSPGRGTRAALATWPLTKNACSDVPTANFDSITLRSVNGLAFRIIESRDATSGSHPRARNAVLAEISTQLWRASWPNPLKCADGS